VIVGHRTFFEDRARERGYTMAKVMPCVVKQDNDIWTVDETHPAYPRIKGPGTKLKEILGWFLIRSNASCACDDRAQIMDKEGPQWCRDNLDTIVGWLREEANHRRLPFVEMVARQAVLQAVAWSDAQSPSGPT